MEALDSAAASAHRGDYAVLDVRASEDFDAFHVRGSGHVPLAELTERRSELPPRDAPVLVVGEDGERARLAAGQVEALGYSRVAWLAAAPRELPAEALGREPAARLWRPSPFLEEVLPRLTHPGSHPVRVLDLAAGAGRESVFLAMHGYVVEAWDHDRDVLVRARAMAVRHGVEIETRVQDLEIREPPLPVRDHDVVMVFRFLHRPILRRIGEAVAPGGCLVYETYLKGQERFGRPKHPRFLLDPGELPRHFEGFEIERYEESTPDEGPFLARLLARRPR